MPSLKRRAKVVVNQIFQNNMASIIFTKKENGLAVLYLNRPKVFNSFNDPMRQALIAALDDCRNDPSVRAVLITGEGKAFCAGQDLAEVADATTAPSFEHILDEGFNRIVQSIRVLEKPVVAAVNGVAAGAGANIALACDIVVAAESAQFIQAFSKIGLIPDSGGTLVLPRLIGFARASALMMLGEKVSATEAVAMGMIYKCFDDQNFKAEAMKLGDTLAAMPTRGLALTKQALNATVFVDLDKQLRLETILQGQAAQTADYTEGVNAFVEKRKPVFKGV